MLLEPLNSHTKRNVIIIHNSIMSTLWPSMEEKKDTFFNLDFFFDKKNRTAFGKFTQCLPQCLSLATPRQRPSCTQFLPTPVVVSPPYKVPIWLIFTHQSTHFISSHFHKNCSLLSLNPPPYSTYHRLNYSHTPNRNTTWTNRTTNNAIRYNCCRWIICFIRQDL